MILRPTTGPEDWKGFLAQPDLHWKPGRSAMEAAHAWEERPGALPAEIAALFPPGTGLAFAVPEYKVPLPGGDRASQTDVFALLVDEGGLWPCMVEAKRDEPFGPTLGDWRREASPGKTARLAALAGCLGLDPVALPGALRYQLLHRAGSAVLTARRFALPRAAMVVQSFSPEHRWFDDFAAFAALFGRDARRGALASVPLASGITLSLGWASAPLRTSGDAP